MRAQDPTSCEWCGLAGARLEELPRTFDLLFDETAAQSSPRRLRLCPPCARHVRREMRRIEEECRERSRLGFRRRREAALLSDLLIEHSTVTPSQLRELMKAAPCSVHALAAATGVAYQTAKKAARQRNVSAYFEGVFYRRFRVRLVPDLGGRVVPEGRPMQDPAAMQREEE